MANILTRTTDENDQKKVERASTLATPVEGTSETHVNVFKADVEDALKQAHAVINEIEEKYLALLTKLGV